MSAPLKNAKPAKAKAGDILRILLPSGMNGFGKVLYTSRHFRNVLLLGLARGAFHSGEVPQSLDFSAALFYASVLCPSHIGWDVADRATLTTAEAACSLRIVAGDVWLGDTSVRVATDSDRSSLPQMTVLGCGILQKRVYEFFTNDT